MTPVNGQTCRNFSQDGANAWQNQIASRKHYIAHGPKANSGVETIISGTDKVPQRNYVTKILLNVRVNFLVRFASNPLYYWVMTGNPLELFRQFFGAVLAIFWLCEPLWPPELS